MRTNIISPINWVFGTLRRYRLDRLFKYGLVGICAATSHALIAAFAHFILAMPPTLSNFMGFLAGGIISYLGCYYFTFNIKSGHGNALPRFALTWIIGIVVNIGVFKALLEAFHTPFLLNVFVAIVLTPILQFLMLRFWAFRHVLDGKDIEI